MQNIRVISSLPMICRHFSVGVVKQNSNVTRQAKFMRRLIVGGSKKKKSYTNKNTASSILFVQDAKTMLSSQVIRRMNILNKVFMEYITDLMSTGEISMLLEERKIEITNIEVTRDFQLVNVFWTQHSKELHSMPTEQLLEKCAFDLRHELSQLRVISYVPPIKFVRCKQLDLENEVERRLQIADYGDDYQRPVYSYSNTIRVTDVGTQGDANATEKDTAELFYVTLPEMRNDVFGLDHHRIMTKIKVAMKKSKASEQKYGAQQTSDVSKRSETGNNVNFLTQEEQDKKFATFLKQRAKLLKGKQRKTAEERQMHDSPFNLISNSRGGSGSDEDENIYSDDEDDDDYDDSEFSDDSDDYEHDDDDDEDDDYYEQYDDKERRE